MLVRNKLLKNILSVMAYTPASTRQPNKNGFSMDMILSASIPRNITTSEALPKKAKFKAEDSKLMTDFPIQSKFLTSGGSIGGQTGHHRAQLAALQANAYTRIHTAVPDYPAAAHLHTLHHHDTNYTLKSQDINKEAKRTESKHSYDKISRFESDAQVQSPGTESDVDFIDVERCTQSCNPLLSYRGDAENDSVYFTQRKYDLTSENGLLSATEESTITDRNLHSSEDSFKGNENETSSTPVPAPSTPNSESEFYEEIEYTDEECDKDSNSSEDGMRKKKKSKRRVLFSPEQVLELTRRFSMTRYISPKEREDIARHLKMKPGQVKIWFQNHRYKLKKITSDCQKNGFGFPYPALFYSPGIPVDGRLREENSIDVYTSISKRNAAISNYLRPDRVIDPALVALNGIVPYQDALPRAASSYYPAPFQYNLHMAAQALPPPYSHMQYPILQANTRARPTPYPVGHLSDALFVTGARRQNTAVYYPSVYGLAV